VDGRTVLDIFVDADGCPVKAEVYRVANRYGLAVTLVANSRMRVPDEANARLVVDGDQYDAADDWIVENIDSDDIAITADVLLAQRCLRKGARVIGPRGRVFREESIGSAVAMRDLSAHLREIGVTTGGPTPMRKRDRSEFLQRLDEEIQSVRRSRGL
jgi:uncharacterized protein YaiI (UPF0178 family)